MLCLTEFQISFYIKYLDWYKLLQFQGKNLEIFNFHIVRKSVFLSVLIILSLASFSSFVNVVPILVTLPSLPFKTYICVWKGKSQKTKNCLQIWHFILLIKVESCSEKCTIMIGTNNIERPRKSALRIPSPITLVQKHDEYINHKKCIQFHVVTQ